MKKTINITEKLSKENTELVSEIVENALTHTISFTAAAEASTTLVPFVAVKSEPSNFTPLTNTSALPAV